MTYFLRPASSDDCASLSSLGLQVWLDTYAQDGIHNQLARYAFETFSTVSFAHILSQSKHRIWVAENQGHMLAYLQLARAQSCPQAACEFEVKTLYVLRHAKSQGIGTALLAAAEEWVHEKGGKALWLSVNSRNQAALDFYAARQFNDIGETYFEMDGVRHTNRILIRPTIPPAAVHH